MNEDQEIANQPDSPRQDRPEHRRWLGWLAAGLALEICLLTVGVGAWWLRYRYLANEEPAVPIAAAPTTVSPRNPNPPTATGELSITLPATVAPATETSRPQPTLTASPTALINPPTGKIVFTCFDGAYDQICLMNADGSNRLQLTDDPATNFYPSLSPDGNQIVFSSRLDGNFEIHIMNSDGTGRQALTDGIGNLYAPEISPKGNRIVFTAASGSQQSIWVMKLDGSNPHPLENDSGADIDPTWSPTAAQIAFASARDGDTRLYIMNADGSNPHPLPGNIRIGGRSSWSPDGQSLAYYAGSRGAHEIYQVDIDGKNQTQLTGWRRQPGAQLFTRWALAGIYFISGWE